MLRAAFLRPSIIEAIPQLGEDGINEAVNVLLSLSRVFATKDGKVWITGGLAKDRGGSCTVQDVADCAQVNAHGMQRGMQRGMQY